MKFLIPFIALIGIGFMGGGCDDTKNFGQRPGTNQTGNDNQSDEFDQEFDSDVVILDRWSDGDIRFPDWNDRNLVQMARRIDNKVTHTIYEAQREMGSNAGPLKRIALGHIINVKTKSNQLERIVESNPLRPRLSVRFLSELRQAWRNGVAVVEQARFTYRVKGDYQEIGSLIRQMTRLYRFETPDRGPHSSRETRRPQPVRREGGRNGSPGRGNH